MSPTSPDILVDGLVFPESPRWHAGRLWLSDLITHQVLTVGLDGAVDVQAHFAEDNPSGLGFLPGGDVLVALMRTRRIMRIGPRGVTPHADLVGLPVRRLNDMHTGADGTSYVDGLVASSRDQTDHRLDALIRVDPDGMASVATSGLTRPNGVAALPAGRHLVVAESEAHRLTRLRIADDGALIEPELFADVTPAHPDGISVDAEGSVWLGSPYTNEFLLVRPGGTVIDRIETPGEWAVACALGGASGRTLFLVTARTTREAVLTRGESAGFVSVVEVDVPTADERQA